MVRVLGHRQTKGAATDHPSLPPPRHISTLQNRACTPNDAFWPGRARLASRLQTFSSKTREALVKSAVDPQRPDDSPNSCHSRAKERTFMADSLGPFGKAHSTALLTP